MTDRPTDGLIARASAWLVQCGACDFGLANFGCNCPPGDPRAVIADLVAEVERLRLVERDGDR